MIRHLLERVVLVAAAVVREVAEDLEAAILARHATADE